jgi:formylmethanofuran dehydrogenase subunit B
MAAYIGKTEVSLDAAIARASALLATAKMPVVAGSGADVAGVRAALRLAARTGGAVDFCRGPGAANLLRAILDKGLIFTTPQEARNRADVFFMIGPAMGRSEAIVDILEGQPVLSAGESARRDVLWLCPPPGDETLSRFDMLVAEPDGAAIHGILSVLSAIVRSRPMNAEGFAGMSLQDYEEVAGRLITARYGVIAFSPEDLDALAIEALFNFAEQLGHSTRVTLLPIVTDAPSQTAALVSAWTTGFPPRLGFARGYPEFDFWRFDAERLSRGGECDALVWLSPFAAKGPDWKTDCPVIAVTRSGAVFARAPDILIETEMPSAEGGEIYDARSQSIQPVASKGWAAMPSPAGILARLIEHMGAQAA